MRKSDILILLAMTLNIIMPFNMPKNNDIQPTAETINEVYIYEAVPVPVYVTETIESYFEMPEEEMPDIQPQEINEDFDILLPSGYDCEQLLYSVQDKYRYEMAENVPTILEAEEKYGVNALYLMCKLGLESGWAKYPSGENNLGGWTNADGSYMDFDSEEECIMYIAENLSTEYKEKSGTRLADVCERYCPSDGYSETLIDIMVGRKEKIEEMEAQSDELRI